MTDAAMGDLDAYVVGRKFAGIVFVRKKLSTGSMRGQTMEVRHKNVFPLPSLSCRIGGLYMRLQRRFFLNGLDAKKPVRAIISGRLWSGRPPTGQTLDRRRHLKASGRWHPPAALCEFSAHITAISKSAPPHSARKLHCTNRHVSPRLPWRNLAYFLGELCVEALLPQAQMAPRCLRTSGFVVLELRYFV